MPNHLAARKSFPIENPIVVGSDVDKAATNSCLVVIYYIGDLVAEYLAGSCPEYSLCCMQVEIVPVENMMMMGYSDLRS